MVFEGRLFGNLDELCSKLHLPPIWMIHLLKSSPLLTVQPRIVIVLHSLLPQDQKEEERILDQSRGLHEGE